MSMTESDTTDCSDCPKKSSSKNLPIENVARKLSMDMEIIQNGNSSHQATTICTGNNTPYSKYDKTYYDPQELRPKRIVCSEIVSKYRLTTRDKNIQNPIRKSPNNDDETFFENLKTRINKDREKNGKYKYFPERSSIARKRRGLFTTESLNLIKKFREDMVAKSERLSVEHGIFSMASRNNSQRDQENFHTTNLTKETMSHVNVDNKKNSTVILTENFIEEIMTSESDQRSLHPTPQIVMNEMKNQNYNLTSPSSSIDTVSLKGLKKY